MIRAAVIISAVLLATACSAQPVVEEAAKPEVKAAPILMAKAETPPAVKSQSAKVQGAKTQGTKTSNPYKEPSLSYDLNCNGVAKQGGAMLCRTSANAKVKVGRSETQANDKGQVIIGFDRDAAKMMAVTLTHSNGKVTTHKLPVEPRQYKEQRIDGLPPSQVSEYSAEDLKRIRSSSARKKVGFASNQDTLFFADGFEYPVRDFIKTSPFGSRRILNGEPKRPHYGVDIAAPLGTPIYAPADGVVTLADNDLYFEGAMVMIDHGQGLNSLYLHVNDTFVQPGDLVKRGDKIAEIGSKGRSTGPHLCWRLKWKKENLDPELLTQWPGR